MLKFISLCARKLKGVYYSLRYAEHALNKA